MGELRIQNSSGAPINSVEDWFRLAPPKRGERQWKDGRSAKELAKAFFRDDSPRLPSELQALFAAHPATHELSVEIGIPEHVTRLDNLPGEHRNHDMVLYGHADTQRVLVAVEAKADEPFGSHTVEEYLRRVEGSRSNVPKRIEALCQALFGRLPDHELSGLRYQLLTAAAGTLIEARRKGYVAEAAVFVIYEFITNSTSDERLAQNSQDLDNFIRALGGRTVAPGELAGPFDVPGGGLVPRSVPLLIGKAKSFLRTTS